MVLSASDPLPYLPRRVLVAGVSGSGKTTLASRVAATLEIPRTELDSLFHGPNWEPRPTFITDVESLAASDSWVSEWQYDSARPILLARAQLLIWLDYPVQLVMWRLIRRTFRRRLRRIELWNGNYEGSLWSVFWDNEHIIRWGWRTRHKYDSLIPQLAATMPELTVVRLRNPRETQRWLDNVANDVDRGL